MGNYSNKMGAKKKGKKKAKAEGDPTDKKPEEEETKVEEKAPEIGYVNLCLRLVKAPVPKYCFFNVHLLTSMTLLTVIDQIVEYNGRIENIRLYEEEPVEPEPEVIEVDKKGAKKVEVVEEPEPIKVVPAFEEEDYSKTLFEVLGQHWGAAKREDAEEKCFWYDFTPFNAKDPLLRGHNSAHWAKKIEEPSPKKQPHKM